eukprot:531243-Alexandrium_andersonii.AAC.1
MLHELRFQPEGPNFISRRLKDERAKSATVPPPGPACRGHRNYPTHHARTTAERECERSSYPLQ